MQIPEGFRYAKVMLKGRPKHEMFDDFYLKHPFMDTGKRAKIFAPFDALAGFNELILAKEVHYVEKTELSEEQENDLNRKIDILSSAIKNSRDAREKNIKISVKYFVLCTDILNDAYGIKGQYVTESGTLWRIDIVFRKLQIDNATIDFDDIISIEGEIFPSTDEDTRE